MDTVLWQVKDRIQFIGRDGECELRAGVIGHVIEVTPRGVVVLFDRLKVLVKEGDRRFRKINQWGNNNEG